MFFVNSNSQLGWPCETTHRHNPATFFNNIDNFESAPCHHHPEEQNQRIKLSLVIIHLNEEKIN
jgi:hypothetical protein